MNQLFKIKPKHKEYIRLVAGIIILILGLIFMLVPFIPLGYVFLIAGLFLLSYKIPFFRKIIDKIKRKDKKGRVEKVEKKIDEGEKVVDEKLVDKDQEKTEKNKSAAQKS